MSKADIWSEHDATHTGQAVCESCGANQFELGVNGAGSVKIRCADCNQTAGFCWDGEGNKLHAIVPESARTENATGADDLE